MFSSIFDITCTSDDGTPSLSYIVPVTLDTLGENWLLFL